MSVFKNRKKSNKTHETQKIPDNQINPEQVRMHHHTGFKLYCIATVAAETININIKIDVQINGVD